MAGHVAALFLISSLAVPTLAGEQATLSNVEVRVQAYVDKSNGGSQPNSAAGTGPIQLGKAADIFLSMSKRADRCGFSSTQGPIDVSASLAWTATVTPIRIEGEAVTFRIRWSRAVVDGKASADGRGDDEVTLWPAKSLTLDHVSHPGDPKCGFAGATLVATVERGVNGWRDARLVETDLWFVEHLPNGKDDTRHQVVRGPMYESVPFYFDAIQANGKLVDFHGEIAVRPASGYLEVQVLPRRRTSDPGTPPRPQSDYNSQASMQLKPTDVGSWEMPAVSSASDPLAGRSFSLRVQVRQIR